MSPEATPKPAPSPAVEPAISADFLLFVEGWYAITAKGAPGYQRNQEGRR